MGQELEQDQGSHGLTEENILHIPGLLSRWVKLADGRRAHYVTSGETGPAVVLVHGGIQGSSGTAGWRFMAPFLGANGFRVFCPDMPGYGLSDTSPEYWPTQANKSHTDFLKMFVDALCLDKVYIGGNSKGTHATMNFVVNHPDRVLGYMMIAAGAGPVVTPEERIPPAQGKFTPKPDYKGIPWNGTEESMRDLMNGIIYEPKAVWPELITMRNIAANLQKQSNEAERDASAKLSNDPNYKMWFDLRVRLPKVTFPAIYLYGRQDVLGPVENGFLQEDRLPNVQFFYPDECGHQGQTDQPELFNQVFLEFHRDGKVSWETAERAAVSRRRAISPELVESPRGGLPKADPARYVSSEAYAKAVAAEKAGAVVA